MSMGPCFGQYYLAAREDAGFKAMAEYINRRQNTVSQFIATGLIMDLCEETERTAADRTGRCGHRPIRLLDNEQGNDGLFLSMPAPVLGDSPVCLWALVLVNSLYVIYLTCNI